MKRALISSVVSSKLLYTASIWAKRGFKGACNHLIIRWQSGNPAIRITRCSRTVLYGTSLDLAETPLSGLLVMEHSAVAERFKLSEDSLPSIRNQEKESIMSKWQDVWSTANKEACTRKLLSKKWCGKLGKILFTLNSTQALTGHGCFGHYPY